VWYICSQHYFSLKVHKNDNFLAPILNFEWNREKKLKYWHRNGSKKETFNHQKEQATGEKGLPVNSSKLLSFRSSSSSSSLSVNISQGQIRYGGTKHMISQLKGQCHKKFCFRFFSWNIFPQAPDNLLERSFEFSRKFAKFAAICEMGEASSPQKRTSSTYNL